MRVSFVVVLALAGCAAQDAVPGAEPPARAWPELAWPDLSVQGDFVGRKDDRMTFDEDGGSIGDRARLRRLDLDVAASLGEHVDAFAVAGFRAQPTEEFEADVEQAWVRAATPVAGAFDLEVRAGRFRSSFGRFNELRVHELPQIDRPLVLRRFLGDEGYARTGASARVLGATPNGAHAVAATLEAVNGGGLPVLDVDNGEAFDVVADVDWSWTASPRATLLTGASLFVGDENSLDAHLFGVDALLSLRAAEREWLRSVELGGELLRAQIERAASATDEPGGFYVWTQAEIVPSWYAGVRVGAADDLDEPSVTTDELGVYAAHMLAENLRFTLGWQRLESEDPAEGRATTLFIEMTFGFGAHPLRPFWTR